MAPYYSMVHKRLQCNSMHTCSYKFLNSCFDVAHKNNHATDTKTAVKVVMQQVHVYFMTTAYLAKERTPESLFNNIMKDLNKVYFNLDS